MRRYCQTAHTHRGERDTPNCYGERNGEKRQLFCTMVLRSVRNLHGFGRLRRRRRRVRACQPDFFCSNHQPPPPYSTQILVPLENRRGPRQKLSPPSHPDLISQSDKGGGKRKGRHHSRHPWRQREPQQQLWEEIWERISHGFAAGLLPFPGRRKIKE